MIRILILSLFLACASFAQVTIPWDQVDKTGATKADVGLDQVDNTSDAAKPISTAVQAALDLKADTADLAPVATSGSTADLVSPPVYFMMAFRNDENDGARIYGFGSGDGRIWGKLGTGALYTRTGAENSTRDPRMFTYKGRYYICYTTVAWGTGTSFGIITTDDFINWRHHVTVSCVGSLAGLNRVWSPKPFVDSDGQLYIYFSAANGTGGGTYGAFSQFYVQPTSEDLSTWGAPVLLNVVNFPASHIDGSPVKVGNTYHFFFKDEINRTIQRATGPSATGPFTQVTTGDWAGFGSGKEGISLVQVKPGTWRIYYEHYALQGIYYSESSDTFETWSTPVKISIAGDTYSNPGVYQVTDSGIGQKLLGLLLSYSHTGSYSKTLLENYAAAVINANWEALGESGNRATIAARSAWQFFLDYRNDAWGIGRIAPSSATNGTATINMIAYGTGDMDVTWGGHQVMKNNKQRKWENGVVDAVGSGSPEGVLSAPVGSTYRRTDGGADTSFYVKESGSGNTGWVAK